MTYNVFGGTLNLAQSVSVTPYGLQVYDVMSSWLSLQPYIKVA